VVITTVCRSPTMEEADDGYTEEPLTQNGESNTTSAPNYFLLIVVMHRCETCCR
jgi:hypothetical protein